MFGSMNIGIGIFEMLCYRMIITVRGTIMGNDDGEAL